MSIKYLKKFAITPSIINWCWKIKFRAKDYVLQVVRFPEAPMFELGTLESDDDCGCRVGSIEITILGLTVVWDYTK